MTDEPIDDADRAVQARVAAIRALDDLLAGRISSVGDLDREWPDRREGDALLRCAYLEGAHALVTGGALERRIVALVKRFLEEGGTPSDYEAAYDALVRAHTSGSS